MTRWGSSAHSARRDVLVLVVVLAVLTVLATVVVGRVTSVSTGREVTGLPPDPDGYFPTRPAGAWEELPGDDECAARVRRSSWEPRPDNYMPNHRTPNGGAVRDAFSARPRARMGAYSPRWDEWLLPRVTGRFTGTTDEILQWAACKWGIGDNVLRAVAMRESGWYQYEVYSDGSCVVKSGCGDMFEEPTAGSRTYCRHVSAYLSALSGGTRDSADSCPRTFSIVGVMAWHAPDWGRLAGNQNGTFPFSVESTAFAVDYLGSFLRGCLEGWVHWLARTGPYRPGDLDGCLGSWYAGTWRSADARGYAAQVAREVRDKRWLTAAWRRYRPPCSPEHGCPEAAP